VQPLTTETLRTLLAHHEPPCASLYMPTHRRSPDNLQDPIRFKNLARELEASLGSKYPTRDVRGLLAAVRGLRDDHRFWAHRLDGLAVLASANRFEVFGLPRRVPELAIAADSFHLKPLLRHAQSADRYHVLCLDRAKARLYEGNRYALDEVALPADFPDTVEKASGAELTEPYKELAARAAEPGVGLPSGPHAETAARHGHRGKSLAVDADTERFFRAIDRELTRRYSAPSGLPLVLVALPEHHAEFRRVTHNPHLLPDGVGKHPNAFSTTEQLRAAVWEVLLPHYQQRLAGLCEGFRTAAARGLGSDRLDEVAAAVVASRVGLLLVDADRQLPGRLDPASGVVHPGELSDPMVDDVLDDLAEEVLRRGGEVVVAPRDAMPTTTGLAATYRF
jgi:hypothetical protein